MAAHPISNRVEVLRVEEERSVFVSTAMTASVGHAPSAHHEGGITVSVVGAPLDEKVAHTCATTMCGFVVPIVDEFGQRIDVGEGRRWVRLHPGQRQRTHHPDVLQSVYQHQHPNKSKT